MKVLAPNTLIQNRYLIVHLIGKGGMGEVYLAVDQRLGSAVALKRTLFADDELLGGAFEREAKILARLRHAVLPKVSDHFTENGEQYLVMEHITGDDLSKRLEATKKPFPLSWILFWADQLLDALSYLHTFEPPIIHRDIKPQNLKLTDDNNIILLDFGLSKHNAGAPTTGEGNSSQSIIGYTPHYAPMEQIRGTGTNPRSDIYALSATLFHLMTNNVPADALSRADAMINNMPDPLKTISSLNPEIMPVVGDVIRKGLEISQEKRFATAREMQRALREAYSQMQAQMSAQTIAFSAPAATAATEPPKSPTTGTAPSNSETDIATQVDIPINKADIPPPADPQATMQMPEFLEEKAPARIDSKAEVFTAEETPVDAVAAVAESEPTAQPFFTETFDVADAGISKAGESAPASDATVPLITFDESAQKVISGEEVSADESTYDDDLEDKLDYSVPPPVSDFQTKLESAPLADAAAASAAPVKKKSGGKAFLVFFGLLGVVALALAAVGGGLYAYMNGLIPGLAAEPTPTPFATPSVIPTLEPTPIAISNSNVSATDSPSPTPSVSPTVETISTPEPKPTIDNSGPIETKTPVVTKTPTVATPRPTVQASTPKPTVKPTVAPTPKATPKRDTTVILQ